MAHYNIEHHPCLTFTLVLVLKGWESSVALQSSAWLAHCRGCSLPGISAFNRAWLGLCPQSPDMQTSPPQNPELTPKVWQRGVRPLPQAGMALPWQINFTAPIRQQAEYRGSERYAADAHARITRFHESHGLIEIFSNSQHPTTFTLPLPAPSASHISPTLRLLFWHLGPPAGSALLS